MFFIAYFFLEVPSNLALLAFGAFLATRAVHDPAVERASRPEPRFTRQPRVATRRARPVA